MTLIIGIKCSDGVVMGADGAATLVHLGQSTVLQPTKKLTIVGDRKIIVGVSGSVGLAQRICGETDQLWKDKGLRALKPFEAMAKLRLLYWEKHVGVEVRIASEASKILGNMAVQGVLSSSMVAVPLDRSACLLQFDQQCAPEEVTDQLPFASIGSGQHIADPFLAFLRRIFWRDRQPTINEGVFATVWTLQHAIETNPGGVADPIQIATLERSGSDWEVRECSESDLAEHKQAVRDAETKLATFKDFIQAKDEGTPPEPPEPKR